MLPQNFKWLSPYEMTTHIIFIQLGDTPKEACESFPDFYMKGVEELIGTIFFVPSVTTT